MNITNITESSSSHFAGALPVDDQSYAAGLVERWERQDPRDRWHYTGEPPPAASAAVDAAPTTPGPAPRISTIVPTAWRETQPTKQRWLAASRIPMGDVTMYTGNGGTGKTETAVQLLVAVACDLGDWLGCVLEESGAVLFLSCEEPEVDMRERVERICKHRGLDPYAIEQLHLVCPDLEQTWLVNADKTGRVVKTTLFEQVENWIAENRPVLVIIDSIAAVFDGDAIARRQVRSFIAMLRKLARAYDTAIVVLDHPSVRGMVDGTGTANSVDWRNSVRSMLHLSVPDRDDPDRRTFEVVKSNRGRPGEKVTLRWNGLTFTTDNIGGVSPRRAAADREIDELFLRLLDKRNAQGRPVHANAAKGSAPSEFALDPEANAVTADGFRLAMERLLTSGDVVVIETGPGSRRRSHLETRVR